MNGKELAKALHNGERIYGTLVTSTSPKWIEGLEGLNIDCVFIDTEHIPMDWNHLGWMCRTFTALGIAPIVRICRADPIEACRVLDIGAAGIVAAYIETAEEVKLLRGALKLRPLKGRKLQDMLAGRIRLEGKFAEYIDKFNDGRVLLVNIESTPAIEALDEILAVPGLDGVLIGPHDLSCSLGVPEQYDHPLVAEAFHTIITKARAKNIGVGVHNLPQTNQEIKWAQAGLNMILHLSDMTLFKQGLQNDLNTIRMALGDRTTAEKPREIII